MVFSLSLDAKFLCSSHKFKIVVNITFNLRENFNTIFVQYTFYWKYNFKRNIPSIITYTLEQSNKNQVHFVTKI